MCVLSFVIVCGRCECRDNRYSEQVCDVCGSKQCAVRHGAIVSVMSAPRPGGRGRGVSVVSVQPNELIGPCGFMIAMQSNVYIQCTIAY